ncbi:MAG: hypothetical protein LBJ92_01575 [Holosporales bacterium]|jgi:hypothetical protein|nr:hypothetical protein [Holosporales bacterium]
MHYLTKTLLTLAIFYHQANAGQFVDYPISETPTPHLIFNDQGPTGSAQRHERIRDGDILNFAASGLQGGVIRLASNLNDIPNPLRLSHSGMVVVATPTEVTEVLNSFNNLAESRLDYVPQPEALMLMRESLQGYDPDTLIPFCLEATGTPGQVFRGIPPHVQLTPLELVIENYPGNVYVRQLRVPVPHDGVINFAKENLARPYEGFATFTELLRSTLEANKEEDTRRVFCSELVALFCRQVVGINIENVSNVIPEMLGSWACAFDILQDKAGAEITLIQKFSFDDDDTEHGCCLIL